MRIDEVRHGAARLEEEAARLEAQAAVRIIRSYITMIRLPAFKRIRSRRRKPAATSRSASRRSAARLKR